MSHSMSDDETHLASTPRRKGRPRTNMVKMGSTEGRGAHFRLGVQYPLHSLETWQEALCVHGAGSGEQDPVYQLCREALHSRIEFLAAIWNASGTLNLKTVFFDQHFYAAMTETDPTALGKLSADTESCNTADFESPVHLYARLAFKLDELLQRNLLQRERLDRSTVYDTRADLPVVLQPYTTTFERAKDRHWHLIFMLVQFIRLSTNNKRWLAISRRQRPDNVELSRAVDALSLQMADVSAQSAQATRVIDLTGGESDVEDETNTPGVVVDLTGGPSDVEDDEDELTVPSLPAVQGEE